MYKIVLSTIEINGQQVSGFYGHDAEIAESLAGEYETFDDFLKKYQQHPDLPLVIKVDSEDYRTVYIDSVEAYRSLYDTL